MDQLVGSTNELEVVPMHELRSHLRTEQPAGTSRTNCPTFNVFGIGPDEIAKCTCRGKNDFKFLYSCRKPGALPGSLFVYFGSLQQIYRKIANFSGIRTRIVEVEGKHTNHLTTTTAQFFP